MSGQISSFSMCDSEGKVNSGPDNMHANVPQKQVQHSHKTWGKYTALQGYREFQIKACGRPRCSMFAAGFPALFLPAAIKPGRPDLSLSKGIF